MIHSLAYGLIVDMEEKKHEEIKKEFTELADELTRIFTNLENVVKRHREKQEKVDK